jgi:hypothetical protein
MCQTAAISHGALLISAYNHMASAAIAPTAWLCPGQGWGTVWHWQWSLVLNMLVGWSCKPHVEFSSPLHVQAAKRE